MRNKATIVGTLMFIVLSACGSGGNSAGDTPKSGPTAGGTSKPKGGADFTATPVQLTSDPCALVTKAEAEAVIGAVNDTPGTGTDGRTCVYVSSKSTGGQLAVSLQAPDFCKLLFLALDKNFFGGSQVRVDDVGDGGMQVKGNGNVQFVVKGGCVEVDGSVESAKSIDDQTILDLAKRAAGRVS